MARYREEVCIYYMAAGQCKKGREASHKQYCQKCGKYIPRVRLKHKNRKKEKLGKIYSRAYLPSDSVYL